MHEGNGDEAMAAERGYLVEPKMTDVDCHWCDSHASRMGDKIAQEQRKRMRRAEALAAGRDSLPETT
jgi:hypothetical protein